MVNKKLSLTIKNKLSIKKYKTFRTCLQSLYPQFTLTTDILFIKEMCHFNLIDEAMPRATELGAKEFFLCADNTYDECGSFNSVQHFDYIPIYSKFKHT
ncbi:TPA: hypothetical protein JBI12_05500 [Legionella pneumophila]|nr:hypothetical protein [Legionella pneumophila]